MKKIKKQLAVIILAAFTFFTFAPVVMAGKIQLPEGTEVKIRFAQDITVSSKALSQDSEVPIMLEEPISIGGEVVVEAGAQGKAVVVEIKENKAPGKPGYIKVAFKELTPKGGYMAANEGTIPLSGEVDAEGKGQSLLAYITLIGILLIKGTPGEIDTDQVYTANVSETIMMEN